MGGEQQPALPGLFGPGLGIAPSAVEQRLSGQQSQSGAEYFGSQVSHGDRDPSYITAMEQFEGLSHQEIYEKVGKMRPGVMRQFSDTYEEVAIALSGGLFGAHLAIQRELSDGMDGQFADAANQAARKFYDQSTDVQEVIRSVGLRIKAAAYGAEVVRKSVPPPPTQLPGIPGTDPAITTSVNDPAQIAQTVVGATDPVAAAALDRFKEEQRLVAVEAMNLAYKPTYQPAGEGVPTFVPVQGPGDQSDSSVPGEPRPPAPTVAIRPLPTPPPRLPVPKRPGRTKLRARIRKPQVTRRIPRPQPRAPTRARPLGSRAPPPAPRPAIRNAPPHRPRPPAHRRCRRGRLPERRVVLPRPGPRVRRSRAHPAPPALPRVVLPRPLPPQVPTEVRPGCRA